MGVDGFVNYNSNFSPQILTSTQKENAASFFRLCTVGMTENLFECDFVDSHRNWLITDQSLCNKNTYRECSVTVNNYKTRHNEKNIFTLNGLRI
ncbi:MAG: hypothetical protein WDM90_18535 [Ferruginibacter sp.]